MTPGELIERMAQMSAKPSTKPFVDAAQRAVVKAQTDLARFNTSSATSFATNASDEHVSVRWRTVSMPGRGSSRLNPSTAIKAHLANEMKTARQQMRDQISGELS